MKTYLLFYRDGEPFLREKNNLRGLISPFAYAQHEQFYEDCALYLSNPVYNKTEYFQSELETVWQFREKLPDVWIDLPSEPSFVDTSPDQYRVIFRVKNTAGAFQDQVRKWVFECFGEEVANNKIERAWRFIEEAIELGQACGITKEDTLRIACYVFSRPEGDVSQEVGGTMVTLAALCFAQGVNMTEAGEAELFNNWSRISDLRYKYSKRNKNNPV